VVEPTGKGQRVVDVPRHLAVIMDGNGRWARKRGLPRQAGHRAGIKPVRALVEACAERGVEVLTLFAFSSENWRRPEAEVSTLMGLFVEALQREVAELHSNNVQLRFVGHIGSLQQVLQDSIASAQSLTANNDGLTLIIAVAYGGRWDLARAARRLAEEVVAGELDPAEINEAALAARRALAGLPDVDLLIRTGGERRVSNFLLWDIAYAELYFTDQLWPDFGAEDFDAALEFFAGRERRFGQVTDQAGSS
jgi:undecaprenyl diphosphate synthase